MMGQQSFTISLIGGLLCSLAWLLPLTLHAQLTLDGSMGVDVPLAGPDYAITADLGRQAGNNLFHSFEAFNLYSGESATFSGPETITNIISRVTGGTPSWIDGTLRATIPEADFYFLNPAGVIFGANAALDLSGSFYVSTADYLTLEQHGRFDALHPSQSILTSAAPEHFGFLNAAPADIVFSGAGSEYAFRHFENNGIRVDEGQSITIAGGNIILTEGLLEGVGEVESRLHAPGGRIDIAAVAAPGELNIHDPSALGDFSALGNIRFSGGSYVSVTGANSGIIRIRGDSLHLNNSPVSSHVNEPTGLYATAWGDTNSGGIDIVLRGDLFLSDAAEISSNNFGAGNHGQVHIDAHNIYLLDGGSINVFTVGSGDGSDVVLRARGAIVIDNMDLFASGVYSSTFDRGNAGAISITAHELILSNDGTITGSTSARRDGAGQGAAIDIHVHHLQLLSGGDIETSTFGAGDGGRLSIHAAESILISGAGDYQSGLYVDTHGSGNAGRISVVGRNLTIAENGLITANVTPRAGDQARGGDIDLVVENLHLQSGGSIEAATFGTGPGGNISINATNRILITGPTVTAGNAAIANTRITSNSQGPGDAGSITIRTRQLDLEGPAGISAAGFDRGAGGIIDIEADGVNVTGGSASINVSNTYGDTGSIAIRARNSICLDGRNSSDGAAVLAFNDFGKGGEIHLQSPEIILKNSAWINVDTVSGRGGDIFIDAQRLLLHRGVLFSTTAGSGDGGNIHIRANRVDIIGAPEFNHGVAISNTSINTGNAGNIDLEVHTLAINNGGSILSSSHHTGNAGNISITAQEAVALNDGTINATAFGEGRGGDISLDGAVIHLQDGAVIGAISRGSGDGGSISISASKAIRLESTAAGRPSSGIVAGAMGNASATGRGGDITILTPELYLDHASRIDTSSITAGDGGSIQISAGSMALRNQAGVTAEGQGSGRGGDISIRADTVFLKDGHINTATRQSDGGNILIQAARSTYLGNASISTAVQGGQGHGGNITITPGHLVLHPGNIIANAFQGDGGNIHIHAKTFTKLPPSSVSASSLLGVDGIIDIDAPQVDVSGFSALPTLILIDTFDLSHNPCMARFQLRAPNIFVVTGRDGLPLSPDLCIPLE